MKCLSSLLGLILAVAVAAPSAAAWNELEVKSGQTNVLSKVTKMAHKGTVTVFDLDSTAFDNRPRNLRIFQEYASAHNEPSLFKVKREHFTGWPIAETLENAGFSKQEIARIEPGLKTFWKKRFFTSEYAKFDVPLPGIVDYINKIYNSGATIVYLTGRNELMRKGSEQALKYFGFPINQARSQLIMKPAKLKTDKGDNDYKASAAKEILKMGKVIAYFDNEPSHVNKLDAFFTEAEIVFVDTDHSPKKVKPFSKFPQIYGFLTK